MSEFYQGIVDAANSGNKAAIQKSTSRETYEKHVTVTHIDYGMMFTDPWGLLPKEVKEGIFVLKHPIASKKIGRYEKGSKNISTNSSRFQWEMVLNNEQSEGSSGNAFRHALWQATIRSTFGFDIAKEARDAHEDGDSSYPTIMLPGLFFQSLSDADRACDLINNKIGRIIGSDTIGKSMNEIADAVIDYQYENGLFEAFQSDDGLFSVQRVKMTEEAYRENKKIIDGLDENGRKKPVIKMDGHGNVIGL